MSFRNQVLLVSLFDKLSDYVDPEQFAGDIIDPGQNRPSYLA